MMVRRSLICPTAIYGYLPGKKQLDKGFVKKKGEVRTIICQSLLYPVLSSHSCMLAANDQDHARMRRLLNHAFSETALREQEPLMNSYFDLLVQKLSEKVDGPAHGKVNMVRWFNFTTFDLVGDLCFGEDFDALRTEEYV